jgi:hypothetical protein
MDSVCVCVRGVCVCVCVCVSEIEKEVVPTPRGMLASSAELDAGLYY